jgi:uncharacterized membrane protein
MAACDGPSSDGPSKTGAEVPNKVAAGNESSPGQLSPQSTPAVTNEGDLAQAGPQNPCLIQGADRVQVVPIRAVGTEPFWGARVEGRCVTYSTPDDQQGVRVWTRYSAGRNGSGAWVGQLGGKKFEMQVRPKADCSDGMSDKRYPLAIELAVNGEKRTGCAEPL